MIANTTGAGDLTFGNGILVVDAVNGGTTVPGTFSLGRPVLAGPYEYSLYRGSVDATASENWYLRSSMPPGPPAPGPVMPDYRREASLYAALPAMGLIYSRTIIDSLHERIGEQRLIEPGPVTEERTVWCKNPDRNFRCTTRVQVAPGVARLDWPKASVGWARIIGQRGDHDGGAWGVYRNGPNFDYGIFALQAGLDLYRGHNADGRATMPASTRRSVGWKGTSPITTASVPARTRSTATRLGPTGAGSAHRAGISTASSREPGRNRSRTRRGWSLSSARASA